MSYLRSLLARNPFTGEPVGWRARRNIVLPNQRGTTYVSKSSAEAGLRSAREMWPEYVWSIEQPVKLLPAGPADPQLVPNWRSLMRDLVQQYAAAMVREALADPLTPEHTDTVTRTWTALMQHIDTGRPV